LLAAPRTDPDVQHYLIRPLPSLMFCEDIASVLGSLYNKQVTTRLLGHYLDWSCTSKWIEVYLGTPDVRVLQNLTFRDLLNLLSWTLSIDRSQKS
jgi:hypothetical protein